MSPAQTGPGNPSASAGVLYGSTELLQMRPVPDVSGKHQPSCPTRGAEEKVEMDAVTCLRQEPVRLVRDGSTRAGRRP